MKQIAQQNVYNKKEKLHLLGAVVFVNEGMRTGCRLQLLFL